MKMDPKDARTLESNDFGSSKILRIVDRIVNKINIYAKI